MQRFFQEIEIFVFVGFAFQMESKELDEQKANNNNVGDAEQLHQMSPQQVVLQEVVTNDGTLIKDSGHDTQSVSLPTTVITSQRQRMITTAGHIR
jgi:hypothetical protein